MNAMPRALTSVDRLLCGSSTWTTNITSGDHVHCYFSTIFATNTPTLPNSQPMQTIKVTLRL